MKQCTKCKEWKELDEFHKDSRAKSGYYPTCKSCKNQRSKEYQQSEEGKKYFREWQQNFRQADRGKEYYEQYRKSEAAKQVRKRFDQSDKGKAKAKRHRKTETYRAKHREANQKYRQNNPEKIKAQSAVMYAVEVGSIPNPSTLQCVKCSNQANQYHHHKGYDREFWLDVVPVCPKCHSSIHSLQKTQNASLSYNQGHP